MAVAITDYFGKGSNGTTLPLPTTLSSQKANGAASMVLAAATGWPTDTPVHCLLYQVTAGGAVVAGTITVWKGILSGTTVGTLTLKAGTDATYPVGSVVVLAPTDAWVNDMVTGLLVGHNQDGTHKTSLPLTTPVLTTPTSTDGTFTTPTLVTPTVKSWNWWETPASAPISTITALGNRSYTMLVTGVDLTSLLGPGTRIRATRTVSAPTQCTSLNGTTQYWVKTSPNKLTFTDDFVVSAWVKLTSIGATSYLATRYNGTSGFIFFIDSTGRVSLQGNNAGAGNASNVTSVQSVPVGRWVHVTAQLDMSAFTATATTSYVMFDGVDVPAVVARSGTNPTALVQAGNLEIGGGNGGTNLFPGKIAQVAIYNAKVTQATILASIHQTLAGTETSLASAYSFNNAVTDLNVTTPNDLSVGGGSAVATNTDTPYGIQGDGTNSATLEYGIVTAASFSTNTTLTIQVPIGGALPTSGGMSALLYSGVKVPYLFPASRARWLIDVLLLNDVATASPSANTYYNGTQLVVPIGEWLYKARFQVGIAKAATTVVDIGLTISTANNTIGPRDASIIGYTQEASGGITTAMPLTLEKDYNLAAQATYYLNYYSTQGGATSLTLYNSLNSGHGRLVAELAYL